MDIKGLIIDSNNIDKEEVFYSIVKDSKRVNNNIRISP